MNFNKKLLCLAMLLVVGNIFTAEQPKPNWVALENEFFANRGKAPRNLEAKREPSGQQNKATETHKNSGTAVLKTIEEQKK